MSDNDVISDINAMINDAWSKSSNAEYVFTESELIQIHQEFDARRWLFQTFNIGAQNETH